MKNYVNFIREDHITDPDTGKKIEPSEYYFKMAIKMDPKKMNAYRYMYLFHKGRNRIKKALIAFRSGLINASDATAMDYLNGTLWLQNNYKHYGDPKLGLLGKKADCIEQQIEFALKAINKNNGESKKIAYNAFLYLGIAYNMEGNLLRVETKPKEFAERSYDRALTAFEKASTINPRAFDPYAQRYFLLSKRFKTAKKNEEILVWLNKLESLLEEARKQEKLVARFEILYWSAKVALMSQKMDEGKKFLDAALELNPKKIQHRKALFESYKFIRQYHLNKANEAGKKLEKIQISLLKPKKA